MGRKKVPLCSKSPEMGRDQICFTIRGMALNVKALLTNPEHPPVVIDPFEDKTAAGAQNEKFQPQKGAKEKALDEWQQQQTRLQKLLDVL